MYDAWFSKPVPISGGISGDIRNLSNARQAIDMLANHWRNGGSDKHRLNVWSRHLLERIEFEAFRL